MNEASACKSVLIEVLTILSKDLNKLAVVGGWVPELLLPNKGHIGSIDVDLALDASQIKPQAYESIRKKLADAGYQQDPNCSNRFYRNVKNPSLQVRVDLITGANFGNTATDSHLQIQELLVWKARGVDLAFIFQQPVSVDGILPEGGYNKVTALLPTIPAYICIKAITLNERKKEKDAYDIYFCVDKYPGGYKALASEYQKLLENELVLEGLRILKDKFARIDSIGPVWAAQMVESGSSGTGSTIEYEQRRAFELINALLREIAV